MTVPKSAIRALFLGSAIFAIAAMDGILFIAHLKQIQDSGISMGLGFLQLAFLALGTPIIIVFYLLSPSWRWGLAMLPLFCVLIALLFK